MDKQLDLILLVDDDQITNHFNEYLLRKLKIASQIITLKNGEEALQFISKTGPFKDDKSPRPDLVFLDINMPRMNGFEFLDHYSKQEDAMKKEINICLLTTSMHRLDREKAESYSYIHTYVQKPLNKNKVIEIVNKIDREDSAID